MPKAYVCPFWKWEDKLCVHCEGGKLHFPDVRMKKDYVCRYCAQLPGWEDCSVAGAWVDYYERV